MLYPTHKHSAMINVWWGSH